MHRHHLVPKHMGGDDSEENLTPPISVELHAEFHRWLWIDGGRMEDYIAWKALSGRITSEEARLAAAKAGQKKSIKYKESRKLTGECVKRSATFETRSAGGKAASKELVKWIKENKEAHAESARINQKKSVEAMKIPRLFLGIAFESLKDIKETFGFAGETANRLIHLGVIKNISKEEYSSFENKYATGVEIPDFIIPSKLRKPVFVDGKYFASKKDAMLGLGRSERYIDNRLKSGRAKYITEEEYHMMMAQRLDSIWEE